MRWKSEVVCPACKSTSAMRINRNGVLERKVLSLFGVYPWKCGACGSAFLWRRRGLRHSSESRSGPAADTTGNS